MPDRRGRRRRPERRRRDAAGHTAPATERPAPPQRPEAGAGPMAMPSTTARATGFMVALVTAVLAVLMVRDAIAGEATGVDAALRAIAGIALIAIALLVAVLVLFPAQLRRLLAARRRR